MSYQTSKISISYQVDEDYEPDRTETDFHQLFNKWNDFDFRPENSHWNLADKLKLMPGIVNYNIDERPLQDDLGRSLPFRVESIVSHAYQLLWGGAFTQSFAAPYTLEIEGSGVGFQLVREENVLRMECKVEGVCNDTFYLEPLQLLKALSEHYETVMDAMFQSHNQFRSNEAFVKGIPLIQFLNNYI